MNVLEAMETCIAMRYLKEDAVPREELTKLIHAATRASNPGNSQGWDFVVIDDATTKSQIGEVVREGMAPAFVNKPEGMNAVQERMYMGAEHLANNFAKVPAWILGCARKIYPPQAPDEVFMYSTIYPAAQNLIVAARSMGIGTCFTTFHMTAEAIIRDRCAIPEDWNLCVFIAVGYPDKNFGKVKRKPMEEVLHWNRVEP